MTIMMMTMLACGTAAARSLSPPIEAAGDVDPTSGRHHHRNHRPTLAYDVGMFNGDDTKLLLSQGYSVVAVEANPVLAQRGKDIFWREISDGSLTIVNAALPLVNTRVEQDGEKEGAANTFYVNK